MLTFKSGVEATAGFIGLGKNAAYKASIAAGVALISATMWGNETITGVEAGKALTAALTAAGCDKSEASRKKILGAKLAKVLQADYSGELAHVRDHAPDMRRAVETINLSLFAVASEAPEAATDKALEAWCDARLGIAKKSSGGQSLVDRILKMVDKGNDEAELSQADLLAIVAAVVPGLSTESVTTLSDATTAEKARRVAIAAALEAKVEAEKARFASIKGKVDAITASEISQVA